MTKVKYNLGHLIKNSSLRAIVTLHKNFEGDINIYNSLQLYITFEKKYTFLELKKLDLPLPYYSRKSKNNWVMDVSNKKLMVELNRLTELGFIIYSVKENPHLQKLLAEQI